MPVTKLKVQKFPFGRTRMTRGTLEANRITPRGRIYRLREDIDYLPPQTHQPDYILVLIMLALAVIGVLMVYSSTFVRDIYSGEGNGSSYLVKQLVAMALGMLIMIGASLVNLQFLRQFSKIFLLFGVLILFLVFIPGIGRGNARRWIWFSSFHFQPSELVKVILILYLADSLARREKVIRDFETGLLPNLITMGTIAILIILQPDFSTAILIITVGFWMLFIFGANTLHLLIALLISASFIWLFMNLKGYPIERIISLLGAKRDFQSEQSLLAMGDGGFWGLGLGVSRQKFFYLPGQHTDFVFSIIGEELGFIGSATVISLFFGITLRGFRIVLRNPDPFESMLALGITSMLVIQALINIGTTIRILPVTGIPLPLISYGRSSMITTLLGLGLLINISRHTNERIEMRNMER